MTDPEDAPIVAAVRKARRQLAKECNGELRKLLDLLKEEQRASGRPTGTTYRPRPDS